MSDNITQTDKVNLKVLDELREFIIPLKQSEKEQLEENILTHGCRDPLVVWQSESGSVLIDGYHRYEICSNHSIKFKTVKLDFKDIEEVKVWMIDNQIGRRNLTVDQLSYYRGLKYLSLKKPHGGYQNIESKGQNVLSTSQLLGKEFNVSDRTIKRDAQFAMGLEVVGASNPELKRKILIGTSDKVKKSDIQMLSSFFRDKGTKIRNEADIYNKAHNIRKRAADEIEQQLNEIEQNRIIKAQEQLQETEPLFLERDDRLIKLKGRIISAINAAIKDKDLGAMKQLKELIGLLEQELFEDN